MVSVSNIPSHSFNRVATDIARVLNARRVSVDDPFATDDVLIHVSSFIWWQQPLVNGRFARVIWYTALEYIPFPFDIDPSIEVVTVSRTCARWIRSSFGFEPRYVYHGIDTDPPTDLRLAEHLRRKHGVFALYIGSNIERKGLNQLIDAVRILRSEGVDINLVMVIHNPTENAEFWKPYRIPSEPWIRVYDVDYLSDPEIHAFYEACSVYVQPSLVEGFGLPPLEASVHGKPIVLGAYDTARELFPGYRRICPVRYTECKVFGHGVFVYRYTDPKVMAEYIWDAINNPDDNLRDYVVNTFPLRNYEKLLQR